MEPSRAVPPGVAIAFLICYAGLCLAGLNPWHLPESTDDITYFDLARSWAAGEGHTVQGEIINDWPPGFPLILSLPIRLGFGSLLAGKVLTVALALVALVLGYRLLRSERRELPFVTMALLALMPAGYVHLLRTGSDWPYAGMTFAFFPLLYRLRDRASLPVAVGAGLLLAAAALTRQVGVLLSAAIISQAIGKWWRLPRRADVMGTARAVWPEALVSVLGASAWLGWNLWLRSAAAAGRVATGNYDVLGASIWHFFEPLKAVKGVAELFFQFENIAGILGIPSGLAVAGLAVFAAVLAIGLWRTIAERRWLPSDAYALFTVAVLLNYQFKNTRFWIPVAPFLLDWFFRGLVWLTSPVWKARPAFPWRKVAGALLGLWAAGCLAIDFVLILKGNGAGQGPLCGLLSRDEGRFYRGLYADMRTAARWIAENRPGARIGVRGWFANYFREFSGGLRAVNHEYYPNEFDVFVRTTEPDLPELLRGQFTEVFRAGEAVVYAKTAEK